jgi:hypothetical protein
VALVVLPQPSLILLFLEEGPTLAPQRDQLR